MLLRALVFYLVIFPACADTEIIEYLIPEEVMGVYQSPYAFHKIDASMGIIDRAVLAAIGNSDVKLQPKVMPAYRARHYARSNPDKKWISYSFSGGTMSSGMAESPSENWMKPGDFTPFHLASFKTFFWYIRPPASAPKTSEDLNGKSVAILKSAGYEPMRQWEEVLNIKVIRARTTQNTIKMLMSGRVDFVFFSEASMRWHFRKMGLNFASVSRVQAPEMLVETEIYLLFGGAISETLRGRFLQILKKLEASGELEEIRRSYHFDAPGST